MEKSACNALEILTIVKGRVQGVGFRATTKYYAMNLGITGTVRNLKDGSVEIYAQGSKQMIEELFQRLKAEFESAKIEVEGIEYFPVVNPMEDFQIIH